MSSRPFIQLSAKQIKELIDNENTSTSDLQKLISEIGFRKKGKASLEGHKAKAENRLKSEKLDLFTDGAPSQKSITQSKTKKRINDFTEPTKNTNTPSKRPSIGPVLGTLGHIRDASNSLKKLPNVFSPDLKETFVVKGLGEAKTNSEIYLCCISALIWEIRTGSNFTKTIHVLNGRREKSLSGEFGYLYIFNFDSDEDLFEGARIDFRSKGRKSKGSIVSILKGQSKNIVLSLDEDFGNQIGEGELLQDQAALLETLQKRYEIEIGRAHSQSGSPVGMNTDLADQVIGGISYEITEGKLNHNLTKTLNQKQREFVNKALKHSVSFLWGPPGTGKTQTLGALVSSFYAEQEKTLICSNTNQAVDQVLLKLARSLRDNGRIKDLEEGKIVRVGRVSQPELVEEFSDYVTIDGIADRKGAEIRSRLTEFEKEAELLNVKIEGLNEINLAFQELENFREQYKENSNKVSELEKVIQRKLNERHQKAQLILDLNGEKNSLSSKGFLGKAFSRSEVSINADLKTAEAKRHVIEQEILTLTSSLENINSNFSEIETAIEKFEKKTASHDAKKMVTELRECEDKLSLTNVEITNLKKTLDEIRKTIIDGASIIGATLTKVFLSPVDFGKFENVIIDEASMGLVPAIYFAASQSKKRCVISGDFRQLKPISQTRNKTIFEAIGRDIFEVSGFEEIFELQQDCPYAGVLQQQYRMDKKICDLISNLAYGGELRTATDRVSFEFGDKNIFDDNVIIIDSSPIYPFCDRDPTNSTSNIVHALIARNIFRTFDRSKKDFTVGYCAPFRAQTNLVNKIIESDRLTRRPAAGTVHTFQGDEKTVMVFDTVDSLGERLLLHPPLAQETAANSEIITVGVSRAQEKIIFIANLRYLDDKLPAQAYLRKLLSQAQKTGKVIDAREVIDIVPLRDEIKDLEFDFQELNLSEEALQTGLVNEEVFFPLLSKDLEQAKKYICFYSGFYTAKKINELLRVLREPISNKALVKVVIPPPQNNGSMSPTDSWALIEKLEQEGIVVELRGRLHQKAVLIDDDIAWFGSLNPLSFSGSTEETMMRINQPKVTGVFASNLSIRRGASAEELKDLMVSEVPKCSKCNSKSAFYKGKHGPYFKCIACDKTESARHN